MAKGKLVFDIDELAGATIERITRLPMENQVMAKEYAVVQCGDKRVMFGFIEPVLPAPKPLLVLYEANKEDGAFTIEEAIRRAEGKPFGEDGDSEAVQLSEDEVDDMTGMPLNGKKPKEAKSDAETPVAQADAVEQAE